MRRSGKRVVIGWTLVPRGGATAGECGPPLEFGRLILSHAPQNTNPQHNQTSERELITSTSFPSRDVFGPRHRRYADRVGTARTGHNKQTKPSVTTTPNAKSLGALRLATPGRDFLDACVRPGFNWQLMTRSWHTGIDCSMTLFEQLG